MNGAMISIARSALVAGLAVALSVAAGGCQDSSRSHGKGKEISAGDRAPRGPDASAGSGNTQIVAITSSATIPPATVPNNDIALSSDVLKLGIEQSGMEFQLGLTPLMTLDGTQPGLPTNSFAPSGGNLVDIEWGDDGSEPNDQWNLMTQLVGGLSGGVPTDPLNSPVFYYEVIPDTDDRYDQFVRDFPALRNALVEHATARHVVSRGVILVLDPDQGVPDGTVAVEAGDLFDAIGPALPPAMVTNVPRASNVLVEAASGAPIAVFTIYSLPLNSPIFSVLTVVADPTPTSANEIFLNQVIDVVLTGGFGARNLDTFAGGPLFIPAALLSSGNGGVPTGVGGAYTQVDSETIQDLIAPLLVEDLPQIGTAPYYTFVGRAEPGVSYTVFDPNVGQLIVDERVGAATVLAQLRGAPDLDDPLTPTVTETSFSHLRFVAVGRRNDGSSSTDYALRAIANQKEALKGSGRNTPGTIGRVIEAEGTIVDAPEGTIVAIYEIQPVFFSFFNPDSDLPSPQVLPATRNPGFFGPAPGFGPVTGLTTGTYNEVLRTTVRPEHSFWKALVPVGADISDPLSSVPFTFEVEESTYVVKYFIPGAEEPIEVGPITARRGQREIDFGTVNARDAGIAIFDFEIRDETGALAPGKITIVPMGGPVNFEMGPQTAISDSLERATGAGQGFIDLDIAPIALLTPVVHSASGRGRFAVPAGRAYQLIASQGTEYEPDVVAVASAAQGRNPSLEFEITRVVNSAGTLSLDAHVHSSASFDSDVPLADRVRTFLAAGVEVLCATDHDMIADLEPAIRRVAKERSDIRDRLHGITGVEATSTVPGYTPHPFGIGHYTAFPVPFRKDMRKRGAPEDEFRPVSTVVQQLRALNGAESEIVNLAHPRSQRLDASLVAIFNSFGYFENLEAGPFSALGFGDLNTQSIDALLDGTPLGTNPLAPFFVGSLGWDTIEIMTQSKVSSASEYVECRRDWFDLMGRGVVKVALGNSDTHRLDERSSTDDPDAVGPGFPESVVGFPRNYVFVGSATPRTVSDGEIVAAMKPRFPTPASVFPTIPNLPYDNPQAGGGRVFITSGPYFADVTVTSGASSGGIGDVVDATATLEVDLTVIIEAPAYILDHVDSAVVWLDGQPYDLFTLSDGPGANQKMLTVADIDVTDMSNSGDHYIVVEVGVGLSGGDTFSPHPVSDPTSVYSRVTGGGLLFAITNPIFIESNGDATTWTPPDVDVDVD